eukprot:m.191787 g.191787  ORF g.191787 m.191787 type:complete len:353 (-) comp13647_c2_seq9:7719-8777(-)
MKVMDVENQEKKVERLVAHAREAEVAALLDSQRRRVEEDINGARNIRINQYLPNFNESDEDGSEDDGGQEDDGGSTTSYDRRSRSESVYTTYTEAVYDEIETHDNEGEYFSSDEEELDNSDMAMSLLEQSGLAAPSYESDNYYNVNETQEAGIQQLSNWSNIGNLPPPPQGDDDDNEEDDQEGQGDKGEGDSEARNDPLGSTTKYNKYKDSKKMKKTKKTMEKHTSASLLGSDTIPDRLHSLNTNSAQVNSSQFDRTVSSSPKRKMRTSSSAPPRRQTQAQPRRQRRVSTRIPVKTTIAGFVLSKSAAKRVAKNAFLKNKQDPTQLDENANAKVEDDIPCTFLGNCKCKNCK